MNQQENLRDSIREEMIQCNYCLRLFKTLNGLKRHRKIKLLCKVKTQMCRGCGNKYLSQKSLITHEKVYCKKKQPTMKAFVKSWLDGMVFTNVPASNQSTIEINTHYVQKLIRQLQFQLFEKHDKTEIVRLLLSLFRGGFISDDLMCLFICEI